MEEWEEGDNLDILEEELAQPQLDRDVLHDADLDILEEELVQPQLNRDVLHDADL
jgi:hypothetical protein